MRTLLAEQSVSKPIVRYNAKRRQDKPQRHIRQAYLTEQIKRECGIIPHLHMKMQINYTAGNKFKCGYYKRAENHLQNKRDFKIVKLGYESQRRKARSPEQKHCAVRISPPQKLYNQIAYSAD